MQGAGAACQQCGEGEGEEVLREDSTGFRAPASFDLRLFFRPSEGFHRVENLLAPGGLLDFADAALTTVGNAGFGDLVIADGVFLADVAWDARCRRSAIGAFRN